MDKPLFDFSRRSWKDAKDVTLREMRRRDAALKNDVALMEQVFDEQQAALAKVLVSVPRDWLVPDAPEKLDWRDPASLDWVQEMRMDDIYTAMNEARDPKSSPSSSG